MKAHVERDNTGRTITISVSDVPDLDVTEKWDRKPKFIRPDRAVIIVHNGETVSIKVSGGQILKSGEPSTSVQGDWIWRQASFSGDKDITVAPQWVRDLWDQAPSGTVAWDIAYQEA
jgi:hypothetical protein